jgi:protein-tyrosine phosphatase
VYTIILDHYPDMVAEVLRTIAAVADGAVLIHCQAGKDRTGTIAALLLDLAGVPAAWIAADYAESQNRLRHLYQQALAEAGSEENLPFWSRPTATAEMMLAVLEHLRHRYGSTEQYLLSAGVSADDIERLRKKLMGDHPAS